MKKVLVVALFVLAMAGFVMAQTYTEGSGLTGKDKLGAHQNGGRGCVGCHAPHSGARGNGGNPLATNGAVTDPNTGNLALWGQDLGPLYGKTLNFGAGGAFDLQLPTDIEGNGAGGHLDPELVTGVMMCLSCHDGQVAKGAMMANDSYERTAGLLPAGYGPGTIKTLLGDDGTTSGNYKNDHPIGPKANLGAVGVASNLVLATCTLHGESVPCLKPNPAKTSFMAFYGNYGAFNITQADATSTADELAASQYRSGGRTTGVVFPSGVAATPSNAYLVCTTCHTPHSMYTFSGMVKNSTTKGTYPTYFFVSAPYNPGAPIPDGTKASSATQFCRQCHFSGAGGANESSGIMGVQTQF